MAVTASELFPAVKQCSLCDQRRERSDFGPQKQLRDGLSTECRECSNARLRLHYHANRNRYRERGLLRMIKWRYGLDQEAYEALMDGASCAICGNADNL